ncbi:hypothetical protein HNQ07_004697 [Deinococcus metalli]|uniref:Uncharacterized protein n=1 Tax=Deinococcus metalli TaxID=1141878 RepID=A0A7W8KJA0_9DEIO|nr:hypothetical protein [Deinococcus metalli]MBB5379182.1 hypothetical protein [Deinococcus metalli]GHF65303.1 hypothetical protein GCM10017781_46300 [Deinococcus metalli]
MDTFPTISTEKPPFSRATNGVMWAVLSAYARSLPRGSPEYHRARRAAFRAFWSGMTSQGEAVVQAAELGLTRYANLTTAGRALAADFIARLGVPASDSPSHTVDSI